MFTLKENPADCADMMTPECVEEGGLTEDEFFDFDLDKNEEFKDDKLLHSLKHLGWNDPWEAIEF